MGAALTPVNARARVLRRASYRGSRPGLTLAVAAFLAACTPLPAPIGPPGPIDVLLGELVAPPDDLKDRLVVATSPVVEWRAGAWRVAK